MPTDVDATMMVDGFLVNARPWGRNAGGPQPCWRMPNQSGRAVSCGNRPPYDAARAAKDDAQWDPRPTPWQPVLHHCRRPYGREGPRPSSLYWSRIPSVSTPRPAHAGMPRRGGNWMADQLAGLGVSTPRSARPAPPDWWMAAPGRRAGPPCACSTATTTYRPVDPLDLMDTRSLQSPCCGRARLATPYRSSARGASDDKASFYDLSSRRARRGSPTAGLPTASLCEKKKKRNSWLRQARGRFLPRDRDDAGGAIVVMDLRHRHCGVDRDTPAITTNLAPVSWGRSSRSPPPTATCIRACFSGMPARNALQVAARCAVEFCAAPDSGG